MDLYSNQVKRLKRAPVGRISFISTPNYLDPRKLRNMLSVTANKLWGPGACAVARDGRTIVVCRLPGHEHKTAHRGDYGMAA